MDHITEIKRRQLATDPYIPRCSCGWEGEHQTSRSSALDELEIHRAQTWAAVSQGLTPDRMADLEMEAGFDMAHDDPETQR